ncbi:hypothetical protein G6011_08916 [Alternaria panax]|uniref:Uncharacterized protein n=1 Tax=Alternaria panax TaxID=48097 RepID=A0AAD4IA63_9PLEO|nr:hypothetical protein G6011_08916 [Alternaria panax]
MAITLQAPNSAKPPNVHTEASSTTQRNETDDDRGVQYRQLISRAVTQRLHSPSLDGIMKTDVGDNFAHPLEAWETQERCTARDKAQTEAEILGIPWAQFVRDVESATREVHVLTPTRYEAPPRDKNQNEEASRINGGLSYKFGTSENLEQDKEWKGRDAAIYNMLRAFQRALPGG